MKIIYQRWFLEYKFPKHNQIVDKELPKGWKLDKIGTLFESQSGYAFKSRDWTKSGIPVLTIKCIKEDGSINYKESSFIEKTEEKLNKYYAQKRKYDFGDEW